MEVQIDQEDVKRLIMQHLRDKMGEITFVEHDVKIETKSKQNYRSEWEEAAFRARLTVDTKVRTGID